MSKISENVMLTKKFTNSVWYRVACDCGDPRCDAVLELERDDDMEDISMHIYKDVSWIESYYAHKFFKRIYERMRAALKILFTGRLREEGVLMIFSKDHIDNFIKALEEGKSYLLKENNNV